MRRRPSDFELFNGLVSIGWHRKEYSHKSDLRTEATNIASLFQHLLIVSQARPEQRLLLRQQVLYELLDYLLRLLVTSSDDCRISGNSINSQKAHQAQQLPQDQLWLE